MPVEDDESSQFDDFDEMLLDILAAGFTHEQAGAILHVSAKSVQRRRRRPDFRREQQRRRTEVLQTRTAQVLTASEWAVPTIVAALQSKSETVRLRAAQLLLEHARRLTSGLAADEVQERLLSLEDEVALMYLPGRPTDLASEEQDERR